MKVFRIKHSGNKNILEQVELDIPIPNDDEVLVRHTAIGVNLSDYEYLRGNLIERPIIPGIEAVGIIEKCGKGVTEFKEGQKVGYATVLSGAYAEYRTIKTRYLFPIPDIITDEAAALNMAKGMTAHFLMRRTFFLREGMTIVIHGAAGNIGKLMLRLAREYRVNVIATVRADESKQIVMDLGAKAVFNYNTEDFVQNTQANVVYDFVGNDTIAKSLKMLMPFGLAVSAAAFEGKPAKIDVSMLSSRSLFLTAPKLHHYKQDRQELLMSAMEVCALIASTVFPGKADKLYNFNQIPDALNDIAAGVPNSKVILI